MEERERALNIGGKVGLCPLYSHINRYREYALIPFTRISILEYPVRGVFVFFYARFVRFV